MTMSGDLGEAIAMAMPLGDLGGRMLRCGVCGGTMVVDNPGRGGGVDTTCTLDPSLVQGEKLTRRSSRLEGE